MLIKKVFNNNSILVLSEGRELILTGKGIGYGKREGDEVDVSKIQKRYEPFMPVSGKYAKLLEKIPEECFEVSQQIYLYARNQLQVPLHEQLILDLADHIYFSMVRVEKQIEMGEMFLASDIHLAYPREYETGIHAVEIVRQQLHVELPGEEAGYIAFHIIMAEGERGSDTPKQLMEFISMVLNCVYIFYPVVAAHTDSDSVSRFIVHLRYLGNRVLQKNYPKDVDASFVMRDFKDPRLTRCLKKIAKEVEQQYQYNLSDQEQLFLAVHLQRVLQEQKSYETV
jgi:beta-glucoside operon transcriptional antiterminator